MIPKPVDQITEDDLRRLIGSSESRQLEFKQSIGRSDEDAKEFLKDVSAMANATGGDVIYGVIEGSDENGNTVATEIQGIAGENSDDVSRLTIDPKKLVLIPFDSTPANTRLNFEGRLAYSQHGPGIGYVQLFRSGAIEAVDANLLQPDRIPMREIE